MPDIERVVVERRHAGTGNIGVVTRMDGKQARKLFPALAEVPGARI